MIAKILIFIFGLATGSFLNVCIYRMPRNLSIRKPSRSFCPNCKKSIPWYDNIPILSFILLKRCCRFCNKKIAWRYPIVELITGVLFLVVFNYFGISAKTPIYILFLSSLIAASFIDIEHQIIPDEISLGGLVVGLILSFAYPALHSTNLHLLALFRSFLGALIGGGIIYITGILGTLVFKKEAMGGGDVKLLAMMGAFLGWPSVIIIFFLAPFLGTIISLIANIRMTLIEISKKEKSIIKGTRAKRIQIMFKMLLTGTIPYGPFLSVGAIVALFYKDIIINNFLFMVGY